MRRALIQLGRSFATSAAKDPKHNSAEQGASTMCLHQTAEDRVAPPSSATSSQLHNALHTVWIHGARRRPDVVDFQASCAEAIDAFEAFQSEHCLRLHAQGVLKDASIEALHLPFWLFQVVISVEFKGTLGRFADRWVHWCNIWFKSLCL